MQNVKDGRTTVIAMKTATAEITTVKKERKVLNISITVQKTVFDMISNL